MEKIRGIDLSEVGFKRTITGMIFGGEEDNYLVTLPGENINGTIHEFNLDTFEWEKLLKQMDTLQIEVTQGQHLPKVILRKSQRQIEQAISWKVFRRDQFKCRYCGADNIPMTVDHLVLWENGGPSTVDNLVCACKKCNRTRGNMEYADWLQSDYYKKVSEGIIDETDRLNKSLIEAIKGISINKQQRRRK